MLKFNPQKIQQFSYTLGYTFSNVFLAICSFFIILIYLYNQFKMLIILNILLNLVFYFTFWQKIQLNHIIQIILYHHNIKKIVENLIIPPNNTELENTKSFIIHKLLQEDLEILQDFISNLPTNHPIFIQLN